MGRKSMFSIDEKLKYVLRYIEGKDSISHIASLIGINTESLRQWIHNYQSIGIDGLNTTSKNSSYSSVLKEMAVKDYLAGLGSHADICKKYGIRSTRQLRNWVMKYNGHEKLKSSGSGGCTIMIKGRKTTFGERIEIVQYCIAHNHNYAETSEKYQVSYQQARSYTVKYEIDGVEALRDNRGKQKPLDKMSELERLRAENRILRVEKEQAEMEVSFLKKLQEIERRRG